MEGWSARPEADCRLNLGHAGVLLVERRGSYPLIDLRILKTSSHQGEVESGTRRKVKRQLSFQRYCHASRLLRGLVPHAPGSLHLLDDNYLGQAAQMLSKVGTWNFDIFLFDRLTNGNGLVTLMCHLFNVYGLVQHFQLDIVKLHRFLGMVQDDYHSHNPYHNAVHAADVTQAMYCYLKEPKLVEQLSPLDVFLGLMAAAAHDVDHPGVNQPFLIKTRHHLASLYQNTSVLESHHWRSTVGMLRESGLLSHLPADMSQDMEQQLGSLILATDISRQNEFLTTFREHLDNQDLDLRLATHRHFILQIALKCADVCNPCRVWELSRQWSERVCEEFYRQERSLELSANSFQRQLAAERRRTISAQEEIQGLQEELQRVTSRLKEKERELDATNIYANRMIKATIRKENEESSKRKASSRNSTKDLQTKEPISSLGFPTPPPAVTDATGFSEQAPDEYLSLQELNRLDRPTRTEGSNQKCEEQESEKMSGRVEEQLEKKKDEKDLHNQGMNVLKENAKKLREGSEMEQDGDGHNRTRSLSNHTEESKVNHSHVQDEIRRWNQDVLGSQQATEEARRKKDHLLAKMREIDLQKHAVQDSTFAEPRKSNESSPRPPEQGNHNPSIFSLTQTEAVVVRDGGHNRLGLEGAGRRALRLQNSGDDLAFGNYAPSFRNPASRASAGFPPPPPMEDQEVALEAIGVFSVRRPETGKDKEPTAKDRKSSLMEQLFGPLGTPAGDGLSSTNKMEVLTGPLNSNGMRPRRERLLSFSSGSSTPPASSVSMLQVADSRPAVCAITSFDDDIEELTL